MGSKNKNQKKGESSNDAKSFSGMDSKKKMKGENGGGFVADPMISDPRFASAHTDPRFRRIPRRESKVTLDSRFRGVLTETVSAPVDKRGKKRRKGSGKDSLKEFYRIEEEEKKKDESESESESEQELKALKAEAKRRKSVEESSEEEEVSKSEKLKLASSDDEESESVEEDDDSEEVSEEEEEEEEDTDEDDEDMYEEEDGFEIPEEDIPNIEKETHRLAVVNMDWRHVSAKDLYVIFCSFVPKDGRILSVTVYPTEFGLERMKEEEIHGPKIDIGKKNNNGEDDEEDDDEEEDEDEEVINQKLRAYEISRLKYYFAVVECDSVATADFIYKSCDGIEFERSSNKLDIRFIPDSMEFKHPPRDTATELPSNYQGLEFQSQALQMSKVNLSWDDDEPHRVKTLNQKFKDDQLAALEMKEYIASSSDDESESENDEDENANKKEKGKEKYRALLESNKDDDEEEEEEENGNDKDMDMEVTFHTGLEDLGKQVLGKKDQKNSESVWKKHLRERSEKKKAKKKNKKDDESSSDDDDNRVKEDGDDDFFVKEDKPKKKKKTKKEEVAVEEERSRAELELLLADENGGGEGLKGYNIKKRGSKKGSKENVDSEEKTLPAAELDEPRFAAILSDPRYALDPTDPQFKRSATYVRQLAQKQKEVPESHDEVKAAAKETKPEESKKKEGHEMSSTIKSLKMKMKNQQKDKEDGRHVESSSTSATLARIKKKVKDLSKK